MTGAIVSGRPGPAPRIGARGAAQRIGARGAARRVGVAAVAAVLAEAAAVGLVATAVWLVVTAGQRPGIAELSLAIVAVRALAVGAGLLRYLERLAGHDAVLGALAHSRAALVGELIPHSVALARGRWLARLVADVESSGDLLVRGALPGAAVGVTGLLAVLGTAGFAPAAAAALAGGLLAALLLGAVTVRGAQAAGERVAALRDELSAAALEIARAGPDLAVFGGLVPARDRAAGLAGRIAGIERRAARQQAALRAVAGLGCAAAVLGVVVGCADLAPAPAAAFGVLAAFVLADAVALLGSAPRLAEAVAARRRLGEPAATPHPVPDPPHPRRPGWAGACCPPGDRGAAPHLRLRDPGLDLDLPPGSRVLLAGPSGSGKSTLLAALWRVRAPRGRYTVDGIDAAEFTGDALREVVGGLWQDAHLPRATLRDTLRLARPGAPDADLHRVLGAVGLGADVLAGGMDGVLAEGGENLPGGQRRRLLVARTLLADHPVLLFDEPAEGLPPADADALVTGLLTMGPAGRTVVVVTHRIPDPLPPGVALHRITAPGTPTTPERAQNRLPRAP